MNDRDDKFGRASAIGSKRGTASSRWHRFVGAPFGKTVTVARGWSNRRLPGGEATMWIVLGICAVALILWAFKPSGMPGGADKNRRLSMDPQSVAVAVAQKGSIDITLPALGTVTPLATATATPQVSGQVIRVDFHEGQMVRKGDVLAIIDPRTYQATLDEAKGQLAKDRAALANAQADLKRQRALYAAQATSKQDLEAAEATAKQNAAAVMADQASVSSAAVKLGFTKVTTPISGRVGLRSVDLGNYVSAGQTTGIAVVTQMNPMSVVFAIPENRVGEVVSRMNAGAHLKVVVSDRAKTVLAEGEVSAIDSQISTTTGTVKMRALFDNDDGLLFPNQFVNVTITVDTLENQVLIPVTALQRGSQGTYVFVVKPDKTVTMRMVTPGTQDATRIVITKGLNPGETVVTDGSDRLSEGAQVVVPSGQKIEKVEAAEGAGPVPGRMAHHGSGMAKLFRKLTPAEREKLRGLDRDAARAWIKEHKDELSKRPDQPGGPGGPDGGPDGSRGGRRGGRDGGGPPPPM